MATTRLENKTILFYLVARWGQLTILSRWDIIHLLFINKSTKREEKTVYMSTPPPPPQTQMCVQQPTWGSATVWLHTILTRHVPPSQQSDIMTVWKVSLDPHPSHPSFLFCSLKSCWWAPLCVSDLAAQLHNSYRGALISHGEVPHIDAFPHGGSTDGDVGNTVSIAHEARLERYVCTYRLSRKHTSETQ